MQQVVGGIQRVSRVMENIRDTSIEQSSGIEQVNLAVVTMDKMTQQNVSLVRQEAAATNALKEQAANLVLAVDVFKLSAN
jgi:methyl-accepting chemotaxis protein